MPMILMANAGVITGTGDADPGTWRRLIAYLLQACTAENAQPLPAAPTSKQMSRALAEVSPLA
jgi:hypothetical protein